MATKPTIADVRWATDGGAELDAPTSGDRDSGFVTGTAVVADHHNYQLNQLYKWAQYIDDGSLTGAFALASAISPSTISGSNDNYAPTGYATTQEIRQDLTAAATITGLAGGAAGRLVIVRNLNATYTLTLAHDVTSTAANRFYLPASTDLALPPGTCALLKYDDTSSRWRLVSTTAKASEQVSTPTQIASNQDNYAPTGIETARYLRISSDAARNITGLTSGYAGRRLTLVNVGAYNITLKNDATSTAANRFLSTGDFAVPADGAAELWYDATSSRWRIIGKIT
jgi:hypothetical protein